MSRSKVRSALVGFVALACAVPMASAVPIVQPMIYQDFADLGVVSAETSVVVSSYNYGTSFAGEVFSQAFLLDDDNYLYLYQADNFGPSVLEVMAVSPFYSLVEAGGLTGGEPADFLPGGMNPYGTTYDGALALPVVSFNYPSVLGAYLPAGQHSTVLYLISRNAPKFGEAYVIDGGAVAVEVVVPVPEPATVALLAIGGALVALRRRRR